MNNSWHRRLLRWITLLFQSRVPANPPKPMILNSWSSAWGILYRIRRETPEAVAHATYRFVPAYRRGTHLLLTCDRYIQIRNDGGGYLSARVSGLRDGTPAPGHPVPSHRISLSLVAQEDGNLNLVKARLLWSYPVDFVGSQVFRDDGDFFARLITADLAQVMLYKEYNAIAWEELINELAAKQVQSNHEILLHPLIQAG